MGKSDGKKLHCISIQAVLTKPYAPQETYWAGIVFQVLLPSENHKNSELDVLVLKKGDEELQKETDGGKNSHPSKTASPSVSFLQYVPNERQNDPSAAETLNEIY